MKQLLLVALFVALAPLMRAQNKGTAPVTMSGAKTFSVWLTWIAPASSPDPVAGYAVFRSLDGTQTYQRLNTQPTTATAYTDWTPQTSTAYDYYVVSVDAQGITSVPSNVVAVTIPTPPASATNLTVAGKGA
jgi:fibronectin type 3 domain-containing protein